MFSNGDLGSPSSLPRLLTRACNSEEDAKGITFHQKKKKKTTCQQDRPILLFISTVEARYTKVPGTFKIVSLYVVFVITKAPNELASGYFVISGVPVIMQ